MNKSNLLTNSRIPMCDVIRMVLVDFTPTRSTHQVFGLGSKSFQLDARHGPQIGSPVAPTKHSPRTQSPVIVLECCSWRRSPDMVSKHSPEHCPQVVPRRFLHRVPKHDLQICSLITVPKHVHQTQSPDTVTRHSPWTRTLLRSYPCLANFGVPEVR